MEMPAFKNKKDTFVEHLASLIESVTDTGDKLVTAPQESIRLPGSHDKFLAESEEIEQKVLQMEYVLFYLIAVVIVVLGIPMFLCFRQNCQRVKEIKSEQLD